MWNSQSHPVPVNNTEFPPQMIKRTKKQTLTQLSSLKNSQWSHNSFSSFPCCIKCNIQPSPAS